ncbi:MAG TPA: response regulator transcription factor [Chloroflexota bacterium]|nr:response regulator transcription factor [Chloroflexota bacterium]
MNTTRKTSVLVADDDPRLLKLVQRNLELNGYRVLTAMDGHNALKMAEAEELDLLLLDIMMPGMDGRDVCRRVREFSTVPIIILTAREAEEDKVSGLDAGADDYLTKPFGSMELLARVRAALRRAQFSSPDQGQPVFQTGELEVDFAQQVARVSGQQVNLTPTEFRIVSFLARNAGRVVTQADLLTKVWGPEYKDEAHLLRVNIARLRGKIELDPSNPRFVTTRPGIGYTLNKLPETEPATSQ